MNQMISEAMLKKRTPTIHFTSKSPLRSIRFMLWNRLKYVV